MTLQIPQSFATKRGTSLPPSALPRPPRNLKPPTKVQYDRLSDAELKSRSQTPPKIFTSYKLKTDSRNTPEFATGALNLPTRNFPEIKEAIDYATFQNDFRAKTKMEFSKPDFTSRRHYQRLEENSPTMPPKASSETRTFKRSLLPKYTNAPSMICKPQIGRDSQERALEAINRPNTSKEYETAMANAAKKNVLLSPDKRSQTTNGMRNGFIQSTLSALPPKPIDNRNSSGNRRGGSVSRGENRYRIQF